MPNKTKTEVQILDELLSGSKYPKMMADFIMTALDGYSKTVSNCKPEQVGNARLDGKTWIAVANEVKEKLVKEGYSK